MKKRLNLFAVVAALVAGSLAGNVFSEPKFEPVKVGFVDVGRAFVGMGKRADLENLVDREKQELKEKLEKGQAELEKAKAELGILLEGTDEFLAKKREIDLMAMSLDYDRKLGQQQILRKTTEWMTANYTAIRNEAENYALRHGLDAVLTVNAEPVAPQQPQEFNMLVATRPVLYWNGAYDVTDEIVAALKKAEKKDAAAADGTEESKRGK